VRDRAGIVGMTCWVALVLLYIAAFAVPAGRHADESVFRQVSPPGLESVRAVSTRTLDTVGIASVALVGGSILVLALSRGRFRRAAATAAAITASIAITRALKTALAPLDHWLAPNRSSGLESAFPSGHATVAMALALAAVIVVPPALRASVTVVGGLYAAAVGIALVALGSHYPSDVLGGFLVATACVALALAGLRLWGERSETPLTAARQRVGVAGGVALVTAFAALLTAILHHHAEFAEALQLRSALLATAAVFTVSTTFLSATIAFVARSYPMSYSAREEEGLPALDARAALVHANRCPKK
jgi:membrane-associated phospholipid phosphatase